MTQDSSKAQELFARILEVIEFPDNRSDMQNRLMHETLVLACHEGLKGTRHGFGNLSSQVDSLCKQFHIKPQDAVAIHLMRRHSNSIAPILHNDLLYDCRALALFYLCCFQHIYSVFSCWENPDGRPPHSKYSDSQLQIYPLHSAIVGR